jgi:hypothetical protein
MVFLSILLVLRRFRGWKENLRSEVFEALRALNGDKTPSPDVFPWFFPELLEAP